MPKPLTQLIFATPLGWCGLSANGRNVTRSTLGHASEAEAVAVLAPDRMPPPDRLIPAWLKELRLKFTAFANGHAVSFEDAPLDLSSLSEFRQRVLEAVRAIPFGESRSYAEIAAQAGSPRAARAVGAAMATNRFPILIPCHRVIASGGGLGGFSAPDGINLKQRMLRMEREIISGPGRREPFETPHENSPAVRRLTGRTARSATPAGR